MGAKRKAEEEAGGGGKAAKAGGIVNSKRVRELKEGDVGEGPVIYWMSRDQRASDNWALLYALEQAAANGQPCAVAFNLVDAFLGAGARQFGFMLRGLRELEGKLKGMGVPFFFVKGNPADTIPELVEKTGAGLLVTDYSPLRLGKEWKEAVAEKIEIPLHEVDAHNVVPVWVTSDKREYAARTIRPKIHKRLPEFLKEFPEPPEAAEWNVDHTPSEVDWDAELEEVTERGKKVPEVTWAEPGEEGAMKALQSFLSKDRLKLYDTKRNDPNIPQALSGLSPWLHFGQLSAQRAAIEAAKKKNVNQKAAESFLEELVVRSELADNYCHYEPNYDSLDVAADWAKETLRAHAGDKREFVYTRAQLEAGETHDHLWNAAQMELVHVGKMHGFLRMYWCKKILEWTDSPETAVADAIYLNDTYSLDGRDPNGFTGVMWSIAGIHDQGWAERAVFGKIRYMNYNGCKRKFDVKAYDARITKAVKDIKAQTKEIKAEKKEVATA